jgi:hypothetical protein
VKLALVGSAPIMIRTADGLSGVVVVDAGMAIALWYSRFAGSGERLWGMFSEAIRSASRFTFPYVGLRRRECGQVYSTTGAFVVFNPEGWVLTSAHIVEEILAAERETTGEVDSCETEDHGRCVEHVEIWAVPGFERLRPSVTQAVVRSFADIAVARLEPFESAMLDTRPVLRDCDTDPILQGMSVCRLGYPFHEIQAEWDAGRCEFILPQDAFPVPSFALDGIVSRFHRVLAQDGGNETTFIATSTPGLRGQSGGPLLDPSGRVCGVQSHTLHLDLGFDARFPVGDKTVAERQFLNSGVATHVREVRALLNEANLDCEVR